MTLNAVTEASICNLALTRAGSTQSITSLNISDTSVEASQCRILYPMLRDTMLNEFPLPWTKAYAELDQVAGPEIDGNVANPEWTRSWRYPADCLKVRRLVPTQQTSDDVNPPQTTGITASLGYGVEPWKRQDGQPWPYPFEIGHDETGRLIFTDSVGDGFGLTCVYTQAVQDPSQFAADFADALAWRLAADLAMALGFSDQRRQMAHQEYERHGRRMRADLMNEGQSSIPYVNYQAEVIRARWTGR